MAVQLAKAMAVRLGKAMAVAVLPLAAIPALSVPAGAQPTTVACATSATSNDQSTLAPCPAGSPFIVALAATTTGPAISVTGSGAVFEAAQGQIQGMNGQPLAAPIVGIAESGPGYLLAAADGGVFSFRRSPVPRLDGRSVPACSDRGHRLHVVCPLCVSALPCRVRLLPRRREDGGIFAFGDAVFYGSGVPSGDGAAIGISVYDYTDPDFSRFTFPLVATSEGNLLSWTVL